MGILDRLSWPNFRRASKKEVSQVAAWNSGSSFSLTSRSKPMLLSTVYRCVDLKSDSIGVLPLKIYEIDENGFKKEARNHPLYHILNIEPNENMSRYVFFKTMQASAELRGNAYAYIERDVKNVITQLVYMPESQVSIEFVRDGYGIQRKRYRVVGFEKLVEPRDMLHILNFSYDGIWGVSTLQHARQTINISTSSEEHAGGFFNRGGSISGVLTVEGVRLNKDQKDQIYKTWEERVVNSPNGIAVLEGNMKYQPITVNPKDSQLLESRVFNVADICRFFSVSPVKAFDLTKSSYSTVEATQLQYLTDTLLPIISKFELELNRKLLLPSERNRYCIEFDSSAILRTDKAAEATYLQTMHNMGAITINEIRLKSNLPKVENGDVPFVPVNLQPLDIAVKEPVEPTRSALPPTDDPIDPNQKL